MGGSVSQAVEYIKEHLPEVHVERAGGAKSLCCGCCLAPCRPASAVDSTPSLACVHTSNPASLLLLPQTRPRRTARPRLCSMKPWPWPGARPSPSALLPPRCETPESSLLWGQLAGGLESQAVACRAWPPQLHRCLSCSPRGPPHPSQHPPHQAAKGLAPPQGRLHQGATWPTRPTPPPRP